MPSKNVIDNAKSGSVVVLHDSLKAQERLEYVLPKILEHYSAQGYTFEALNENALSQEIRKIA